jgi:hypothetical protein
VKRLALLGTAATALLLAGAAVRCIPALGPGDSLITSPRILAVRAEPAEAIPGTKVAFTALVAAPGGTLDAGVAWSFCTAPKPLTQDNVVSNACVGDGPGVGDAAPLTGVGVGMSVTAKTPPMGCSIFGPDVGSMGLRPRDPDSTGGYYQPLLATLPGAGDAIELARIHCDLANAGSAVATVFAKAYHDNLNPTLQPLTATLNGAAVPLSDIPASSHVVLQASWPAASAETFAYFDQATQTVGSQREAMQVAWYGSGGTLDTESTGRAGDDPATTSDDGWTAPVQPGTVHLWVVLRDSRGGVDYVSQDLGVTQ